MGTPRIGVLRPAPTDSTDDVEVAATAEARVIRHELERRLGPVTLDLRTSGHRIGPWEPVEHAAWPNDVDAIVELDPATSLLPLFPRTVDSVAADVRRRMLDHLGIDATSDLPAPQRPTDVWLLGGFDDGDDGDAEAGRSADAWLDHCVANLAIDTNDDVARLRAEVDELRRRLDECADEALRVERAAHERIAELVAERDVLAERVERVALDEGAAP